MEAELCQVAPSDWNRHKIEDVCIRVTSGGTPSRRKPEFFQNGTWCWVKSKELQDTWIDDTEEKITEEAVELSSAKVLPGNTVVLALYGATVGQLGILRRRMTCNQACCAMIVDENKAAFRYLFYHLIAARPQLKRLATGAAQQNLSGQLIKSFTLPFPPLKEQQAIACILGALDDKIELNRRMNETLEAIARAIFKSWFVDFLPVIDNALRAGNPIPESMRERAEQRTIALPAPQSKAARQAGDLFPDAFEESELGEIPKGWEVGSLSKVTGFLGGYAFKSKDWTKQGVPVVKIGSVKPGIVDLNAVSYVSDEVAEKTKRFRLATGDLLIGMTGYVGEVGLVPHTDNPPLLNQRVGKFVLDTPGTSALAFLYCLTRRPVFKAQVRTKSHGTAQANVSAQGILSIPVVVPRHTVLDMFNRIAQPFIDRILANQAEAASLATVRDTLLPRLISGELRLLDAERIVGRCV